MGSKESDMTEQLSIHTHTHTHTHTHIFKNESLCSIPKTNTILQIYTSIRYSENRVISAPQNAPQLISCTIIPLQFSSVVQLCPTL